MKRDGKIRGPKIQKVTGPEPFYPEVADWNGLAAWLYKTRNLFMGTTAKEGTFSHPWKVGCVWDTALGKWVITVKAGFLRGHDVVVKEVEGYCAGDATWKRETGAVNPDPMNAKTGKTFKNVPLIEKPMIPVLKWRVAASADKVVLAGSDEKPVPPYFTELGVVGAKVISVDLDTQELTVTEPETIPLSAARQLRSVEIVLNQPRPVVNFVEADGALVPSVDYPDPKKKPPFLRLQPKPPVTSTDVVSTAIIQTSLNQELHIATVWLIGPPGDLGTVEPGEDWEFVSQNWVWWNLDYSVHVKATEVSLEPVVNPALGLTGSENAQVIVDGLNAQARAAEELASSVQIDGGFWTI